MQSLTCIEKTKDEVQRCGSLDAKSMRLATLMQKVGLGAGCDAQPNTGVLVVPARRPAAGLRGQSGRSVGVWCPVRSVGGMAVGRTDEGGLTDGDWWAVCRSSWWVYLLPAHNRTNKRLPTRESKYSK